MSAHFVATRMPLAGCVIYLVFLVVPALAQVTDQEKDLQRVISEQQEQLEAQQAQLDLQKELLQKLQEQMQSLIKSKEEAEKANSQESIDALRSEVEALRKKTDDSADAQRKASVPPTPLAIYHVFPELENESAFVFRSHDGDFSLGIDGTIIGRHEVNRRKADRVRTSDTDQGFEMTGSRINFKGELYNDFGYWLRINADAFGDPSLDAALAYYKFNDDTTLVVGQFPSLLNREQGIPADKLMVSESSPTNYTFDPFGYKGVMLGYHTPRMVYRVLINDGYRSISNAFYDEPSAKWAVAGQVLGMVVGDEDDWERFNNFTSRPGGDFAWLLNGAFHVQQGDSHGDSGVGSDDMFLAMFESSMEGDGWMFYASAYYRHTDLDFDRPSVDDIADISVSDLFDLDASHLNGTSANDFGFVLLGGVWVSEHYELYSRFDMTIPDSDRWIENDAFKTLTLGVNYYPIAHSDNIKLSFEALYMFDSEANSIVDPNVFSSVRDSDAGDQMVFRSSFMIRF